MGASRARRFATAAIAAVLLASVSAVLVATAAPNSRSPAKPAGARQMNYSCAFDLYNAKKVLHFAARPSSCRGSGRKLVNYSKAYPVFACRKEHGGFAARQKRFQFPNGIYGHGPAGLMRYVDSPSQCAPRSQPNETPVTLPSTKVWRLFCAAKRGGELRWVNSRTSCNSREFLVGLPPITDFPVARADDGTTDEDHGTTVSVLANDRNTPTSNSNAGLQIASTDTTGTKGNVTVNPDGTIGYDPNGQFEALKVGQSTTDSFKYRVKRGTRTSAPATVTIKVNGVNDLPVAAGDSASTDSAHTKSIPVLSNDTDADGDALSVSVDTAGTQGNVTVNGDGTVTYDPNHKFDSLGPSDTGHDSFKYKANDGHGDSNVATVDVTIGGLDDPPVVNVTAPATHYTEGDPATVIDSGVTVSDPDNANLQSAQIKIVDGHNFNDELHLPNPPDPVPPAPGGITGFYDINAGVLSLSAPAGGASKADWQAALRTVTFRSASDNPFPTKTLEFTVNDGNSDSAVSTKTITTTNVNDPPEVHTQGGTADFVEDSPPVAVDPGIDVSDPDSLQLQGATVAITANFSSADGDTLNFTDQNGITHSYDSGTGVLTLTGVAAVSDYQTAIQSITFSNSSDTPSTATRTVSIKVKDAEGLASNTDTRDVTVAQNNDAPANNLPAPQSLNEDASLTLTGPTKVSVSDVDAGSDPIKVDLSVAHGKLDLSGTVGLTVTGNGTGSVSATGSQSNINTALDGLKYTPNADYNGPESLGITIDDQGHNPGPAQSTSSTLAITVNPVNDAPVNTVPGAQVTNEDTAITFSGANKPSVSDIDAGSDPIKVTLSVLNGKLDLSGTAGLTVTGDGTATVTATGSQSDINTALDGLKYTPDANYNGADTLQLVTDDQGKNGSGGAQTDTDTVGISVTAVNDAPVNGLPAPQSTDEDTALTLSGVNAPSVSDVDAGSDEIKVTLSALHGTLTLSGSAGLTVTGNGTSSVEAKGSQSDINTALDGLKYTPDANYDGGDTITMVSDDQGHNGSGGAQTATSTITVTVNAVNDPPVNTVPGAQSTNEDTALTFSTANTNQISVGDPDAGAAPIKVDLSVSHGTLTLGGTTGLTVIGDGTAAVSATGSQSDINTALDGLQYAPTANYNGSDSLQVKSDDQGNTGSGGALTDTDIVGITVSAVNDAPVNTVPSAQSTAEDTAITFNTANSNQISVADLDAAETPPGNVQVDLTVSSGTLTLSSTASLTVSGQGTDHVNATGTVADLNTALDGLVYQPGQDFSGGDSLQVQTSDLGHTGSGGTLTDTDPVAITVNAVNDPPAVDLDSTDTGTNDSAASFNETNPHTGDGVLIAPNASVADVDTTNMDHATITITNLVDTGQETLAADVGATGIVANYTTDTGAGTGTLSLTGSAPPSAYEQVIKTIKYDNTKNPPSSVDRSITVVVNDGSDDSTPRTATVHVIPINSPPTLDLNNADPSNDSSASFTENGGAVTLAPNAAVADTDAGDNIESATVKITNLLDTGSETLSANVGATGITANYTTDTGAGTGTLTLTGSKAPAVYQSVLQTVKYDNTSDTPNTTPRAVTFVVNDGQDPSPTRTSTVSVTATNDAPVNSVPAGQSLAEDGSLTLTGATKPSVSDADAGSDPIKVDLSVTHGKLDLATTASLTVSGDGTGSVSITGSQSNINTALDGLKYTPNANYNGSDSVHIVTDDQGHNPAPAQTDTDDIPLTITAVNDAPVNTVPAAQSTDEDIGLTFSSGNSNQISVADPDAAETPPGNVKADLSVAHGTLTLASTVGLTVSGQGTNHVTATGTTADINTALNGLLYQPASNYNGPESLGITTDDLGHTPAPAQTTSDTVAITVNPVNDAPNLTADSFTGGNAAVGNTTFVARNTTGSTNNPADGAPATHDPTDGSSGDLPHKTITGDILSNDSDVEGDSFSVTSAGTSADPTNGLTEQGGTVTVQPDGDFVVEPKAGTSCTNPNDSFTYKVTDTGTPTPASSTATVSFTISGCVWYVNNHDADGNSGTSAAPYDTLSSAETNSGTGDTIFVYHGDGSTTGQTAGIDLKANQKLVGEAATLAVGSDTLQTAGGDTKRPTVTDALSNVVNLAAGNTVTGLQLDPQGGGGIVGGSGDASGTIADVKIIDAGTAGTTPGLDLNGTSGTYNVSNLTVDNTGATTPPSTETGIRLLNAGTVNFASAGTISVKTKGASALDASNGAGTTSFGAGSVFDDITTQSTGGGRGVSLSGTTGTVALGDGSGTDLDLTTTGAGLFANNATNISVPTGGTANISSTGAAAVDITGSTGTALHLGNVSSSGGSNGINFDNNGALTFDATGGTVSGSTNGVRVNAGSGNFSYAGALADGTGSTAAMTSRTGGTLTLSGQITDSNDTGGGISFTGNTGATAVVTNANNVVDTGTTTAIDVENTTIGASGINFKTASSNGAANGIKLDTTGSTGGLNIASTGSGTCTTAANAGCTGGAIQNSTGPGVLLNSVGGPVSLNRVSVNGGGDDGIRATSVGTSGGNGIALTNSVLSGNGTVSAAGNDENGLDYTDVVGTTSITSDVITGSNDFNAQVVNNAAGTLALTVTGSTFSNSGVDAAFSDTIGGSATVNSIIGQAGAGNGNTFTNNKGAGIDFGSIASSPGATSNTTINNNSVTGNPATATDGGIYWTPDGKAKGHLLNNNVQNVSATAMSVQSGGAANGTTTTDVTVESNVIGTSGQPDSGSVDGDGLQAWSPGDGTSNFLLKNNAIHGFDKNGLYLRGAESTNGADSNFTATGNTIDSADPTHSETAILVDAGALSTDVVDVCADVGGAGALANTFSGSLSPALIGNFWLSLRFPNSKLSAPGYVGTTMANRQSYFLGRNTGFSGGASPYVEDGSQNMQQPSPGSCPQPALPSTG